MYFLYYINDRYSLSSDHSIYWPKGIKEIIDIEIVMAGILKRIGFGYWSGFGELAYAIVFEYGSPEFNVNILKHSSIGWKPLFLY